MSEHKGMKNYKMHRQFKELRDGHNPGALGISGWKGMKWSGLKWMYREGKISEEKAESIREMIVASRGTKAAAKGFTFGDHKANRIARGLEEKPKAKASRRARASEIRDKIAELEAILMSRERDG